MVERKSDKIVINYGFKYEMAKREARRDKGVIACERYRAKA